MDGSNPWQRLPCLGPHSQSVLRSYSDKHHRNERSGPAYDQEERDGQNQDADPQFLLELTLLSLTWQTARASIPPTIFSDESNSEVARVTYCRAVPPPIGKCVLRELAFLASWLALFAFRAGLPRVEVLYLRLSLIVQGRGLERHKVQSRILLGK